jgi:hypothetical protein
VGKSDKNLPATSFSDAIRFPMLKLNTPPKICRQKLLAENCYRVKVFMKKTIILLIGLAAFLTSCQTKAETTAVILNPSNTNTNSVKNTVETEESKPSNQPPPTPKTVRGINSKVGIVDVTGDEIICFRTTNADLTEKTPISIVASIYEPPQKVLAAAIEKKLEKSCVSRDSDAGESNPEEYSYYSLVLTGETIDKSEIGVSIGVIQPAAKVRIENKLASVDLNGDAKPEFFRLCTSNEGLHLTIWNGKPLSGKRIWHYYYYLNYDTEPTCKQKDWEGTED